MKVKRKVIEIDEERCDGCGQCIPACEEGAIAIIEGKARLLSESYCDGLGACLGSCPNDAIRIVEREADDYDPEAVEAHLKDAEGEQEGVIGLRCKCPSSEVQSFDLQEPEGEEQASSLSHWPVQIHLVPANAEFLKRANLLVAADCTAVAYPRFHQDFVTGHVVLVGCPKFDDKEAYVEKFTEIFRQAEISGVTVLTMEVPCCSSLPTMIKKAAEAAGTEIPIEQMVIGTRGRILERKAPAA